jgi:hypothetical protein
MFRPENPRYKEVGDPLPLPPLTVSSLFLPARFVGLTCAKIGGEMWQVWQTASLYHLVHTAALVGAPTTKNPNIVSASTVRRTLC